jgi:hypothetical protein
MNTHKTYDILRQPRYRLEVLPSELIVQALRMAKLRKQKRDNPERFIKRSAVIAIIIVGGIIIGGGYLAIHVALWAVR